MGECNEIVEKIYIHPNTQHTHTVDINGIWGEFTLDRLKKDNRYSNHPKK